MQTLEKLSERFWFQTPVSETDRPILGAVIGDNRTLMIDSGNSKAHAKLFLEELKERNIKAPDLVAITHWHWDHIFGLAALNMVSLSSELTKKEMQKLLPFAWTDDELAERVKTGVEIEFCANAIKEEYGSERNITVRLPELTFRDRIEIDLGGVTCVLQHVGGDHAPDSIVVYVKEEKILFLGDSIYPDIYSSKRNYTIERTRQLLDMLEEFDATTYILSHWKPITKAKYEEETTFLRTIADLTEKYQGDLDRIQTAYRNKIIRELTEDEIETIEYFVNGF
ncbi:MBL fold metallo-hydrolase [Anaerobacillus alkaliphilus]|uniref:MBL fold metallo-hydrolase n=1 Tax=Anaerobacillus alkaliphilus TaxID=1548597 RepID=A0A4Q0VTH7_9BACI|nr:MBL fold metallo-hydrolase [Anaerobacillus alkaliphilus]RXJ00275.1 MBL fold metallo-hydrolase [Anaerobacillus alkaliphilus]